MATNLSQIVDLVVRYSPKNGKQGIALLLMKLCFKEKIGKDQYINRVRSHPEMMRKYFWERISLPEMEKLTASW